VTWLRGEGKSERTIAESTGTLRRLAVDHADPADCGSEDLMRFLAQPISHNSRATYFVQLRGFYRFLVFSGRRADDPMARLRPPRVPRGVPHPVETDHLRTLLASPLRRRRAPAGLPRQGRRNPGAGTALGTSQRLGRSEARPASVDGAQRL
jgi:site-specific recombinase XerD